MYYNKAIGEWIKVERNNNGLTQSELGELLGVEQTGVSRLELGKSIPTTEQVRKLKLIFNSDLDSVNSRRDVRISQQQEMLDSVMNKHSWNISTVAKRLGVTTGAVHHWIRGRSAMNPESFSELKELVSRLEHNDTDWQMVVYKVLNETEYDTTSKLAEKLGVTVSSISNWRTGRYVPLKESGEVMLSILNKSETKKPVELKVEPVKETDLAVEPEETKHTLWERIKYVFTNRI